MTVVPALVGSTKKAAALELKAATCCKGTERKQIDTFTKPRTAQCLLRQLTLTHVPTLNREFVFVANKHTLGKVPRRNSLLSCSTSQAGFRKGEESQKHVFIIFCFSSQEESRQGTTIKRMPQP